MLGFFKPEEDVWILRSKGSVWLHFSDHFMCKGFDIAIYLILTGGWI